MGGSSSTCNHHCIYNHVSIQNKAYGLALRCSRCVQKQREYCYCYGVNDNDERIILRNKLSTDPELKWQFFHPVKKNFSFEAKKEFLRKTRPNIVVPTYLNELNNQICSDINKFTPIGVHLADAILRSELNEESPKIAISGSVDDLFRNIILSSRSLSLTP